MLAAATLAAISTGPAVAESLQHNAVAKRWFGASSAEYDPEAASIPILQTFCRIPRFEELETEPENGDKTDEPENGDETDEPENGDKTDESRITGLAAKMSYKCSVDFGSYSVETFQVEDGNTLWPSGSQTSTTRLHEKQWTTEQLQQEMASTVSRQQMMNNKMDGIEKARALTIEIDTPQPPSLCDLEDLMLPVNALAGVESTMRVWDSGATSGMTKPGSTDGRVVTGRWARVMTGAGPVKTNQWVEEDLSWGTLRHIAGQHNSELGVQTSCLSQSRQDRTALAGHA